MSFENVLFGVFGFLGKAIIVFVAYYFGKTFPGEFDKPKWLNYFRVIGITALISSVMWSSYGTHVEDADPLYGGGERIVDFEPDSQERNEYGLIIFLALSIPAIIGVINSKTREEIKR